MTIYVGHNVVVTISTPTVNLSNSAFADPKNRMYPIIDREHVMSALQRVMWQHYCDDVQPYIQGEFKNVYLKRVHDNILKRAKELHMNIKRLHHKCDWCDAEAREIVQFT